jgi:Uma2 family endonuclease
MAGTVAQDLITAEQFARMSFDVPVELVRGEVVEMPRPEMRHGVVCSNVHDPVKAWARSTQGGVVAINDTGVITERDPDSVRGPDVLYITRERLPGGEIPSTFLSVAPDLAIEVLSPHDVWKNVLEKITEYFEAGVREVWVVDPEDRTMQVFRPDAKPRKLDASDTLESPDVLPGFTCAVSTFFEDI